MSYPPTMHIYDDVPCTIQRAEPVRGFVLQPGASARFMVVMRTMKVGQMQIVDDRVVYRQNGRLYGQALPYEFTVHVRTPAGCSSRRSMSASAARSATSCGSSEPRRTNLEMPTAPMTTRSPTPA
jgi:hypothetical protein